MPGPCVDQENLWPIRELEVHRNGQKMFHIKRIFEAHRGKFPATMPFLGNLTVAAIFLT